MKLHIFNPEHDLVLACNTKCYTPSEGIRSMRAGFSYVPVFWAEDGDAILTDDVSVTLSENAAHGIPAADVKFITSAEIRKYSFSSIDPWGWDKALKHSLIKWGVDEQLMPADAQLEAIRQMSHRRNVVPLTECLREGMGQYTCGGATECFTVDEVKDVFSRYGKVVIKAPWSSSGINIIYVEDGIGPALSSRCSKLIAKQGSVLVEQLYNKVKDFAMEFYSDGNGNVDYLGLSVFETLGTAYLNNMIASEEDKMKVLSGYVSADVLSEIRKRICQHMAEKCNGCYTGPFGVDMMVINDDGRYVIDPCVEINLRRTMGHVAIERWKRLG